MSLSEKLQILNVPFEIARYIVKHGLFSEARLYLYLKYHTDGYGTIDKKFYSKACVDLDISPSTIRRNLIWLKNNRWIIHEYKNVYRIVSFRRIYLKISLGKSRIGILWDGPNFQETKAFLIAACVRKIVQYRRVKKRVPLKGGTQTFLPKWISELKHIADIAKIDYSKKYLSKSFFASLIGIPLTTAHDYLSYAVSHKLLVKSSNMLKCNLTVSQVQIARKHSCNLGIHKIAIRGDRTYVLLPNSFECDLCLRTKKELKHK